MNYIVYNNKKIIFQSQVNPVKEAERYLRGLDESANVLILFGLSTTIFLKMLFRTIKESFCYVIAIDIDSQMKNILQREAPEFLKRENLFFFQVDDFDSIQVLLETVFYLKKKRHLKYQIFKNINLYRHFKNIYDNIEIQLANVFKNFYQNLLTINKFKTIWLQNIKKNIIQIQKSNHIYSLESFQNQFLKKPALIINAGPSLDEQIAKIKKWENQFYIIAVDTVLRTLVHHNIQPDFVISLDSQFDNYLDFSGVPTDNLNLVVEITANYKIIENFKGNIFVFYTDKVITDFFSKKSVNFIEPHYKLFTEQFINAHSLQSGGSVSTTALDFALYAGFDPIVFIAQDLSFKNYKIYCKGTYVENKKQLSLSKFYNYDTIISDYIFNQIIKDRVYGENIILSSFVLHQYKIWLEQALTLTHKDIRFFESMFFKKKSISDAELTNFEVLKKSMPLFEGFKQNKKFAISHELIQDIQNYLGTQKHFASKKGDLKI